MWTEIDILHEILVRSQLEDQLQELLLDALRTAVEGKDVAAMRHLMCAARVLGYQPPRDTEEDDSEDHLPPKRRKTCFLLSKRASPNYPLQVLQSSSRCSILHNFFPCLVLRFWQLGCTAVLKPNSLRTEFAAKLLGETLFLTKAAFAPLFGPETLQFVVRGAFLSKESSFDSFCLTAVFPAGKIVAVAVAVAAAGSGRSSSSSSSSSK